VLIFFKQLKNALKVLLHFSFASTKKICFIFKGTVPPEFRLLVIFMNQFPTAPEYTIRAVQIFSKIRGDNCSSRCTSGVVDTSGQWKKSSIKKVLNIYLDTFG
jgi:hypothetical protein